jgi:hypothetical protein
MVKETGKASKDNETFFLFWLIVAFFQDTGNSDQRG